ncbi:MAG: ATP-binding protein [Tissierellia bacterium]|nr:ATP-binding protein [Tissierellia bacterium]
MIAIEYAFKGMVCSELNFIQEFIDEIISELKEIISDEDIIFDTRLIMSELIFNGAIHGNKMRLSKSVRLNVSIKGSKMIINVEDEGRGCCYNPDDGIVSDNCETGRGLILVAGLSDELLIHKNSVTVIKNIDSSP